MHEVAPGARRRSIRGVIAVGFALGAMSCGAARPESDPRPLVLTTFTVLADMARQVAGNHLRVESITKPGMGIHTYEPTPGDLARAQGAVLVLDNGFELEAWFEQFLDHVEAPRVTTSDGVEPLDIIESGRPNPHAWMSPLNAQVYVDNIVSAFSEIDPENAGDYRDNGRTYGLELLRVHRTLLDRLSSLPASRRALVTCEGAFSYLARDAGMEEMYLWPVNSEQQVTPQQVAAVIEFVRANQVPAVFCESTVSPAAMKHVVDATGARFGGQLYVDSLSEPDGPVPTYLDLLIYDVDLIAAALTENE